MTRVFHEDSVKETARKIYHEFEVNQSCTVIGLEFDGEKVICKGEEVCKELRRLDTLENVRPMGKKMTRRRKSLPNSIGGYVAHKIFRYDKVTVDSDIRYTIWRVQ